jgi:hypothetical protein
MRLGLLKVSEQQTGLHWQHQIDGAVETARLADQLGFMEAYFDGPYVDVTSDRTLIQLKIYGLELMLICLGPPCRILSRIRFPC